MDERKPNRPQQVVVADDFSLTSRLALDRAADIACRAPWHVLHFLCAIDPRRGVVEIPHQRIDIAYADKVHDHMIARIQDAFSGREASAEVHFLVHARIGEPAAEILGLAEEVGADLIIVGSHGRHGVQRMVLGSVSEQVVRDARCPVIVARTKGYRDVELARVVTFEHPLGAYQRPHRYGYADSRIQSRRSDWPLE